MKKIGTISQSESVDSDRLLIEPVISAHDPWSSVRRSLDRTFVVSLRHGPVEGVADVDAARALAELLTQEFTAYGTGGGEALTNDEVAVALRSLRQVLMRQEIALVVPRRDFTSFRTYWNANDGYGSWQARRDMVTGAFTSVEDALDERETRESKSSTTVVQPVLDALPDANAIHEHLRLLSRNVDSDPRLAVSVAKDLVESTAKLVLRERSAPATGKEDLPVLVARAQEAIGLAASGVEGHSHETKALKTILGSLSRLAQGITELRNEVGVGHGKESIPTWVRPRHARLAAGAATTWCNLMPETLGDPDAPWRGAADGVTDPLAERPQSPTRVDAAIPSPSASW